MPRAQTPGAVAATPAPPAQELARRVDEHYNRMRTVAVPFTEMYNGMGMERVERGRLLLAKPGRMRWDYAQPAGKVFVMDGKFAYAYTPGDAQAQRYPAKKLDDFRSPLRLLLGHTRVEKELDRLSIAPEGENFELRGIPRGLQQRVAQVELTVTPDGRILDMRWRETDGSTTEFRLGQETANLPMPRDAFLFQAPPGVVVVPGLPPI